MSIRKDNRRKEAEIRQEDANLRTPEEQIKMLNIRLGKGKGAAKERAKLQARIEKSK